MEWRVWNTWCVMDQDYFEYILKKLEAITDNPSIMIYVDKIENRITFNIKTEYYLNF